MHKTADQCYQMLHKEQSIILRLESGHNRLRNRLYRKITIGETNFYSCGWNSKIAEHILYVCKFTEKIRIKYGLPRLTNLRSFKDNQTRLQQFTEAICAVI
uniref:Uncharacterized protein n=1 Tax=Arion vulgaris TaxID=1028688 RepID=A0A0B6YNZ3_9EUPU